MSGTGKFGIVKHLSKESLVVVDSSGLETKLQVLDPWKQFIPFLKIYDEIYTETEGLKLDGNGILVIEPRYLVSVTETIKAISCPRKVYVRHLGASADYDIYLHQRQLKGNLLHSLFSNRIIHGSDIPEAIEQTLDQNRMDLILADFDEQTARNYLQQDGMMLQAFNFDGKSEVDVKHYGHGLSGKLDGLTSSNMVLELKTSKIPDTTPWPDHNIQMNVYQELMSEYLEEQPKGKVIYLSDGGIGVKDPTTWNHSETLIARNWAYLVLTGKYIPPVLRGEDKKTCRSCYRATGCYSLCAGLYQQRDCENCYHDSICTKEAWDEPSRQFFETQSTSTIFEENEIKRQEFGGLRLLTTQSENDVIIGIQLNQEKLDNGKFHVEFSHDNDNTRFRSGDYVVIYPQASVSNPVEISYSGVITDISSTKLLVEVSNSLPKQVEIHPMSTSSLLRRSREAIYKTVQSSSRLINTIMRVLDDTSSTRSIEPVELTQERFQSPLMSYNFLQEQSILQAINTPDFYLIQGPAGTGKTSVIVELVNQLGQLGHSILVSTFTNMALDNVAQSLHSNKLEFVRFGSLSSTQQDIRQYNITNNEKYFQQFTQDRAGKVVLATTTTIGRSNFDDLFFDFVLLDEAAQMTLPNALMALLRGEKAIMVGDHAQLPPIVISPDAIELDFDQSLFERLSNLDRRIVMLKEQYRMNDEILSLPNRLFYGNQLISANKEIANGTIGVSNDIIGHHPYQLLVIEDVPPIVSQVNEPEAVVITFLIKSLLKDTDLSLSDIGIITPFRAQVALLRDLLPGMLIDTIDRFQGSESEIIIFSTVTTADIPILTDPRRINVALTRAKKKMIILQTNPSRIKRDSLMRQIYRDAFRRGRFRQIKKSDLDQWRTDVVHHDLLAGLAQTQNWIANEGEIIIYYNSIAMLPIKLEDEERCHICYQYTSRGVQCPGCGYVYHRQQLIQWIEINDRCPTCKHSLRLVVY